MENTRNYHSIDIAKFIASFFIVGIHAYPFADYSSGLNFLYFRVISRFGVPFFFIASAFFFFKSLNRSPQPGQNVKKYAKRLAQLYLFWFIVNLVPTYYYRFYSTSADFTQDLKNFFRNLLFSSTFRGSWYITASIVCVVILYFASKKLSNRTLLVVSFLIYLFACSGSVYRELLSGTAFETFYNQWTHWFSSPYNSWPAGLFWMALGKYFAENEERMILPAKRRPVLYFATGFFLLIAIAEVYVVKSVVSVSETDAFVSLVPLSVLLFISLLNLQLPDSSIYIPLRNASTITYFSQFLFLFVFDVLLGKGLEVHINSLLKFHLVLALCYSLSYLLINLRKKYKLFRYSF